MKRLLPGDDEALPIWPEFLDEKDLANTQKAVDNVQKELKREIILVQKMFLKSINMINSYRKGENRDILYIEMVVNNIRAQVVKFLLKISAQHLSEELSKKLFAFTAIAADIESIGNHVVLISELAAEKATKKIEYSECGENELREIIFLVSQNLNDSVFLIEVSD